MEGVGGKGVEEVGGGGDDGDTGWIRRRKCTTLFI